MKAAMPLILVALSGCTSVERKAPYTTDNIPITEAGGFECNATATQYAIGKKTSVALAQELMAKAGATILRWIPPRSAVTKDYSNTRLNIGYDDAMVINRIDCG